MSCGPIWRRSTRPPRCATGGCTAQLAHVAAALNEIDIVPVALKGAIRLIDGLWPDPALRFMHDLDLLVPRRELAPGSGS